MEEKKKKSFVNEFRIFLRKDNQLFQGKNVNIRIKSEFDLATPDFRSLECGNLGQYFSFLW